MRQRARELVEALDRRLQVHQPLAGLVVGLLQLLAVLDPRHADPLAAVVGLHEQRVADVLGDRGEVERQVVLRRRVLEARVLGRVLVRDEHRRRHLDPEPDHRAVGRVLLHRLERERRVEQVDVVHHRDLLQPLARDEVPPREAVDDEVVARLVAQVERLDRDPLAAHVMRRPVVLHRPDPLQQRLEGARPVLLGAEQEADQVRSVGHQQNLGRWWAIWARQDVPVVRDVVAPQVELVADPLLGEQPGHALGGLAASRSCPPTAPGRRPGAG